MVAQEYRGAMISSPQLMASHESVRCAEFTRLSHIDPAGTAISAELLIAVELPLPWPKPVFRHSLLERVPDLVADAPLACRVLAAVPRDGTRWLSVVCFRQGKEGQATERTEWRTEAQHLESTIEALTQSGTPLLAETVLDPTPASEVWICTQGSHDRCCGSEGTALYKRVVSRWPDVVVRRVSHTGGHRFAPTAITLPDGRMWGSLDVNSLDAIVSRSGPSAEVASLCRGWWGAATGPAQVAERAVFALEGWRSDERSLSVQVVSEVDGITTVRVIGGSRLDWLVRVGISRQVRTPSCGELGGEPSKLSMEYEVLDLSETAG